MLDEEPPTAAIELSLWDERMFDALEQLQAAHQSYFDHVAWYKAVLDGEIARLGKRHKGLALMRTDKVVLVRNTQGAEVTVYHSADDPCGRVMGKSRRLSSFDKMLEGEVRGRLRRCAACLWR